jgi:hypothetical protein
MAKSLDLDPSHSFVSEVEEQEDDPIALMDTVLVPYSEHDRVLAMWTKRFILTESASGLVSAQLE